MIKKLIIVLLVCGVFWGLIRQPNLTTVISKVADKLNKTKINNIEIKPTIVSENKFIPDEIKQPTNVVIVESDHVISDDKIKTNSILDGNYSKKNGFHGDKIIQTNAAASFASSINVTWNDVKLFVITTSVNHNDNTDRSKQQIQSGDQSSASIKTNKVRCPSVKKIQQAAQQINDAFLYDGTYRLMTYGPAFQDSNLTWLVGVRGIEAGSTDEAIYKAIIAASETNYHTVEYAEIIEGPFTLYFCSYGPGDIIAGGIRNEVLVEE